MNLGHCWGAYLLQATWDVTILKSRLNQNGPFNSIQLFLILYMYIYFRNFNRIKRNGFKDENSDKKDGYYSNSKLVYKRSWMIQNLKVHRPMTHSVNFMVDMF